MARARVGRAVGVLRRLGPSALIVAVVLGTLRRVAFGGWIDLADVRTLWLPTWCFLGRSLAAGHIPAWNPDTFAGAPFAADPQSGWMYLPAMALFSALPCDVAIRAMVVLLPALAGVGLWAFLRSEGLGPPAAVTGGVALAVMVAGSALATALPFSGALAFTALTLAASSRSFRAKSWGGRVAWALAAAVAWGQIAAALLTDGLVIGTTAVAAFLVVAVVRAVRRDGWRRRAAAGHVLLLVAAFPLVNLAYLLPRLAYAPRTDLALGYAGLQGLYERITGRPERFLMPGPAAQAAWPLKLATSPGGHLAAAGLALALAAWRSRRHRGLALAFTLFGVACWALSLHSVAMAIPGSLRSLPPVQFYLHAPQRWSAGVVLAIAVLAAVGVEAWRDARTNRERLLLVGPSLLLWLLVPSLLGAGRQEVEVAWLGGLAAAGALAAATRRPAALALIPVLVAAEGAVSPLVPEVPKPFEPVSSVPALLGRLPDPIVHTGAYVRPGQLARSLRAPGRGRYLTVGTPKLLQVAQRVAGGGFLNEALLFGLPSVDGYNSVQPLRYWAYDRAVERGPLQYNLAVFGDRSVAAMNLLQVRSLVVPAGLAPPQRGARPVARQGSWVVYARPSAPPQASLVSRWRVAPSGDPAEGGVSLPALRAVAAPGFDPGRAVILERDPGLGAPAPPAGPDRGAWVRYLGEGPQAARLEVRAAEPSILLVRTPFDPGWRATVDGRPAPVLRADYLMQGLALPEGRHTIRLAYEDSSIGLGLLGSAATVLVLGAAVVALGAWGALSRRRAVRGGRGISA